MFEDPTRRQQCALIPIGNMQILLKQTDNSVQRRRFFDRIQQISLGLFRSFLPPYWILTGIYFMIATYSGAYGCV
jgi:hypothetical protein